MNAVFNQLDFIHRLEQEGLTRGAAEAIAQGIEERNREAASKSDLIDLATKADVGLLKSDLTTAKSELEVLIARTAARQIVQFGGMIAVAVAIIGVLIGLQ